MSTAGPDHAWSAATIGGRVGSVVGGRTVHAEPAPLGGGRATRPLSADASAAHGLADQARGCVNAPVEDTFSAGRPRLKTAVRSALPAVTGRYAGRPAVGTARPDGSTARFLDLSAECGYGAPGPRKSTGHRRFRFALRSGRTLIIVAKEGTT